MGPISNHPSHYTHSRFSHVISTAYSVFYPPDISRIDPYVACCRMFFNPLLSILLVIGMRFSARHLRRCGVTAGLSIDASKRRCNIRSLQSGSTVFKFSR